METVGYAALQVIPSMRGARSVIEGEMNGSLGAAGSTGGRSYGTSFVGTVGKYARRATVIAGAIMGAKVIKGGIDRALNIDAARGKLAGLGHDAKAIDGIMASALKSVQGTAYGLDAAATTAAGAVAARVKPGRDLTKYLTLAADAASIAGVSMGEMGSIFNKVQTSQRAYTMELNQLADRGIPIYQWLQKEYGVTATELRKMVSKGKVDAATFKRVINDNIGGAAQASGDTMRGTLANLGAAFSRLGAGVVSSALPQVKSGLQGLTGTVDNLGPRVNAAAAVAGRAFTGVIVPAVKAAWSWFKQYLWPAITEGASIIGSALGPAASTIAGAFASMDGGAAGTAATIGTTLASAITTAATVIAQVITVTSQIVALFIKWRDVTVPLVAGVVAIVAAYKTYKATMVAVTAVTRTYTATVTAVRAAQQAYVMGTYGMASGQKGLVAGLANLTGRIKAGAVAVGSWTAQTARAVAVNARWQVMLAKQGMANMIAGLRQSVAVMRLWITTQVRAAATAVASAARATAAWVAQTAVMVANRVATLAFVAAQAVLRGAMMAATAAQWALNVAMSANPIGLVVIAIGALVAAVVLAYKNSETFRNVVTAAWSAIKSVVVGAATAVWSAVQKVGQVFLTLVKYQPGVFIIRHWREILSFFKGIPAKVKAVFAAAGAWLVAAGRGIITGLRNGVTGAWGAVQSFVGGIKGRVVGALASAASWLVSAGRGVINGLRNGITGAWGTVTSWLSGVPGMVKAAVSGAASWLYSAGADVVRGFINGLKSMAGSVTSAVKSSITDKIPGFVKKRLGISSPSKVMKAIAKWIPIGIAAGIRGGASEVEAAIKRTTDRITDLYKKAVEKRAKEIIKAEKKAGKKITQAEATKRAARQLKDVREYVKRTQAIVKAQGKRSKASKAFGSADAWTDALVGSLNGNGKFIKGAQVQNATLKDIAVARDVLANRLAAANEALVEAIKVRDDFAASVASGVRSFTSLLHAVGQVNAYGFQQAVTGADIVKSMTDRLNVVRTFAQNMATLLANGLNQQTYQELIEAGPEAAGAYAQALVDGGATTIAEVNNLQGQINVAANALGSESAANLYQAGVDAAQGLVNGLSSQMALVEAAAKQIGKQIRKAIRKALKIKSPSRLMAEDGAMVPAGLAMGFRAASQVRRMTTAAAALATTAASAVRSGLDDVRDAATAVSSALTITPTITPEVNLPSVRPPWGGDGPGDPGAGGGMYAGPRVVVQQTINNPQAEPTSKTVDAAARTLGLVGAL